HPPRSSPAQRTFTLIPKAAGCVLHKSCATREVALTVNLADRVRSLESILFLAGARLDTRASNGLSRARGKGRNESALGQGARCYLGTRSHVRDKVGKQPSLCPSKGPPSDVWGRPGATRRRWNRHREAPTRVGTTGVHREPVPGCSVHPHARGDDHSHAAPTASRSGTPPRAR